MNSFFTIVIRLMIVVPITITTWFISFFAYDQSFWNTSIIATFGGLLAYWVLSLILQYRFLKKHQLKRKEYRYIFKNLMEAKKKIKRLQKTLLSLRQLSILKYVLDLLRITRRIYRETRKEPRRFYKGEQFYFYHLDSAVELTEKYALLSAQPKKTVEVELALSETRTMIKELNDSIENDLYQILADDIDQLHFEIDMAKHSLKTSKES